jgi:hypothetical protein
MLGRSAAAVRQWALDGSIPACRVGARGRIRIPAQALREAIEAKVGRPAGPPGNAAQAATSGDQ